MFSGIVEEMGTVKLLKQDDKMKQWDGSVGDGVELTVKADVVLEDATLGCSIAVNGVCLTVTEFDGNEFRVGLAPETLRRSNLGGLAAGEAVNLERALPVSGRNSGHVVQGHVDGTGEVVETWPEGDSLWMRIKTAPELLRYIVPKGFVAVDGTSLTVCEVDAAGSSFTLMLVAYTQQHVVLPRRQPGSLVNIEVDVLGKYVEGAVAATAERLLLVEQRLAALEEAGGKASGRGSAGKLEGAAGAAGMAMSVTIEQQMGSLEQRVQSRDLVIATLEERLEALERQQRLGRQE